MSDELNTGPQVAKKSILGNKPDKDGYKIGWFKQIKLYLLGNLGSTAYWFIIYAVVLVMLFGVADLLKAYMCNDFATANRNPAWYCNIP